MKGSLFVLVALVASVVVPAGQVRADYLNWTYSTTPSVPGVATGSAGKPGGTVLLTDFTNQAGGAKIPIIAYLTASSSSSPATFDPNKSAYTLKLTITDNATHDSGTLTFTGSVSGTLSAMSSTLVNSFVPSPNTLTLDGHVYTVSIPPAALAEPTSPQENIFANVTVKDAGTGRPLTSTPEPSALLLCGLGFSCVGLSRCRDPWRRWHGR
jgi:hypothetical protein